MTEMATTGGHRRQYCELIHDSVDSRLLGTPVRIAGLDDIIASKRHANRGKDRAALPELDRIARRQKRELRYELDDGGLDID